MWSVPAPGCSRSSCSAAPLLGHLHSCSRHVTNDPTSALLPRPPQTVRLCFSGASALALPGASPSQVSTLGGSVLSSVRPTPALGRWASPALSLSGTRSLRRSAGPHSCQSSTALVGRSTPRPLRISMLSHFRAWPLGPRLLQSTAAAVLGCSNPRPLRSSAPSVISPSGPVVGCVIPCS